LFRSFKNQQTAEKIGKELGLEIKSDKRLREADAGVFNGKSVKEYGKFFDPEGKLNPEEYYTKRFKIAAPKAENYIAIEKRMMDFVRDMEKKYSGKNILVVSHERPITLLEKMIYGYSVKEFASIVMSDRKIKTGEVREMNYKNLPYNEKLELDFHKPYIDKVKFYCKKCGGIMERVPEVLDVWFDSGSMPFAQCHWLGGEAPKLFPADYISEAIDQTRGWFYTLLSISTLLGFDSPYKNVISLGHVLDEKGEKMSKSKGNIVSPWDMIEKYGIDAVRWYFYTINAPGEPKLFAEKDIDSALKKFILTLWNCYVFWQTYGEPTRANVALKNLSVLDKWIISKLNELIKNATDSLENYDVTGAARIIEKFVIADLSLWYIRRSRKRFQKPESKSDLRLASAVLESVLLNLSLLLAPFVPFLSEEIYQTISKNKFKKAKSIHFENWPEANSKLIDRKLIDEMDKVREIVTLALAERAKAKIKVRQPLNSLQIENSKDKLSAQLLDLIKEEINVKKLIFGDNLKLDTEITPELKEEGLIREIIRNIQEIRKKSNLKPEDKISVRYAGEPGLEGFLAKNKKMIMLEGKIKEFEAGGTEKFRIKQEIKLNNDKLQLAIKKI
jgi:isoleucyl-tRNA synthetase